MARKFRMALTLVVASIALMARAQAAPPPVPGGGGATSTPFFMGSTHSYTYYDADWVIFGPGTLTISSAGLDPYNGAALINVQLKQGAGRYFYGSGVSVSGKLYFTIGNNFFQCDAPGWGSYHLSGHPSLVHWVYLQ